MNPANLMCMHFIIQEPEKVHLAQVRPQKARLLMSRTIKKLGLEKEKLWFQKSDVKLSSDVITVGILKAR